MEKKVMYISVAVIAILLVAGIGAALLLSNNSSNSTPSIKIVTIKATSSSTAYSPLDQAAVLEYANNSANGGYPISRYLYLYTHGNVTTLTGAEISWLNWILTTSKGQKNASDAGFYSLPSDIQAAMQAKLAGTTGTSTGSIVQSGSTTMLEMANLWQASFAKDYPGITISLNFPGSGTGIQNLKEGKCDIAQASRAIKASELVNTTDPSYQPMEFKVAVDGIAIIVNSDNSITSLTIDQLRQIYNGNYTNWNQVGGKDQAIVLYGRDSSSGTYDYFHNTTMGQLPSATMQQFSSTAPIVQQCKDNKGAIGYVGIGYAKEATTASQTVMEGGNSIISLIQAAEIRLSRD
ncbi:MAG TPA: substrate-binding domain-containing protein [Methanomassiliicoccales archaeon]|jgi:phosphate transport system substrate-binding protein